MLACAMRLKLTIQYDGTDFHGWQAQPGVATVQGCVEGAVAAIQGARSAVTGAGRTDAGVHAYGQVAHVDVSKELPTGTWLRALNANLPRDIRIFNVEEVESSFHARMSATGKHYRYRIWTGRVVSPFLRRYVHQAPHPLDLDAMTQAASLLVGRHDFEAFTVADRETKTTVRDLRRLDLHLDAEILDLHAEADGFLRAMVRTLAGTLLAVGDGHMTVEGVSRALESKRRDQAGPTAPAPGLTLVRVDY
jgi:tRNA pseudouridine38-40 synthase